jgi:TetR/AcrR family transcriptional regulator, transcriptional repressor for nem operon
MGRPAEFDRDRALEAAMRLFWGQGYGATSLEDLLSAMAIGRSSFYAAFGDKRSLFVEAVELFAARTRGMLDVSGDSEESLASIPHFFRATLLDAPRRRVVRGCLMVNTVLEMADVDSELSALAAHELEGIENFFFDCFELAQRAGEYPADRTASELAGHIMVLNQGLRVASRRGTPRSELKKRVETGLSLVGLN